ncbi:hypothetical protein CJ030_MR7G027904 [Morella rubra]|uniref:Uncharacterized protein n=1 Tax=Morella rubra TaxID=262757 RepID=A0A6A1V016_9ROSI|nr:hypothetical protein CJ030_MR7G027904 [Morella rubra]
MEHYSCSTSQRKSHIQVEIFPEVLETKAGYVRGLGHSVRFVKSSSLVSFIDLSRRLEEAKLQIEEMRAQKWNTKSFWSSVRNGADDVRALAKWRSNNKKEEEHQKMMKEQQRNLVKQQN